MRFFLTMAFTMLFGTHVHSGTDFGTAAEAQDLARDLVEIINRDGLSAAAEAVTDLSKPFFHTRMGVNLFRGTHVIADNREPESVATDYADIKDLTGSLVWPQIEAASETGGDIVLLWYHYDTQEEYAYHCYSLRAARDDATVMICR